MQTARSPNAAIDCSRKSNGIRTPWRSAGKDSRSVPLSTSRKRPGGMMQTWSGFGRMPWRASRTVSAVMGRQQLDQHAGMGGIEMLDQDESHAAAAGERREERAKRLQPAGGCADRDHREIDFSSRGRGFSRRP